MFQKNHDHIMSISQFKLILNVLFLGTMISVHMVTITRHGQMYENYKVRYWNVNIVLNPSCSRIESNFSSFELPKLTCSSMF